jgi:hypothetical protein
LWLARWQVRIVTETMEYNRGFAAFLRGDHARATEVVSQFQSGRLYAGANLVLGMIARDQGRFQDAECLLNWAGQGSASAAGLQSLQVASVRAEQALLAAQVGSPDAASRIAAAETEDGLTGAGWAQLSLARALLHSRADQTSLIQSIKGAPGAIEHLRYADRLLWRALEQKCHRPRASIYRAAPSEGQVEQDSETSPAQSMPVHAAPIRIAPAAAEQVLFAQIRAKPWWRGNLWLWGTLFAAPLVGLAYVLFSGAGVPESGGPAREVVHSASPAILLASLVAASIAVALRIWFLRRAQTKVPSQVQEMCAATRTYASGDLARAESEFEKVASSPAFRGALAAAACSGLASVAERKGDWRAMQAHAERGLALSRQNRVARMWTHDLVSPRLHAQRALALALAGETAEARSMLAALQSGHADYYMLESWSFRIELAALTRERRYAEARAHAKTKPKSLNISLREELTLELLQLRDRPATREEQERLWREVARDPNTEPYLQDLVPGLVREVLVGQGTLSPLRVEVAETGFEGEAYGEMSLSLGNCSALNHE